MCINGSKSYYIRLTLKKNVINDAFSYVFKWVAEIIHYAYNYEFQGKNET